ncbi:hypothetical protein AB0E01_39430 [Nocardia vinacea]|uniref:hypothetical protein n=1 Tax=Nocardia vinacea TaxID=96468 RepID=UPI0033DF4A83
MSARIASIERLNGATSRAILGIDFAGFRSGAQLEDLAGLIKSNVTLYRCQTGTHTMLSAGDALDRIVRDIVQTVADSLLDVRAIVGYCSGGHIAAELAKAFEQTLGRRVKLITLDTVWLDRRMLIDEFNKSLNLVRHYADEDALLRIRIEDLVAGKKLHEEGGILIDVYSDIVSRVAERASFSARIKNDIIDIFSAYVIYLVMAIHAQGQAGFERGTNIISKDYAELGYTGCLYSESSHENLMVSREVAEIVQNITF